MHRTTHTTRSTITGPAPVLRCGSGRASRPITPAAPMSLCTSITAKSRTGPAGLLLIFSITDH